jgi:hypothetical protein
MRPMVETLPQVETKGMSLVALRCHRAVKTFQTSFEWFLGSQSHSIASEEEKRVVEICFPRQTTPTHFSCLS